MSISRFVIRVCAPVMLALAVSAEGAERTPHHAQTYQEHSGVHDGALDGALTDAGVAYVSVVSAPGAPWMRVHFGDHELGNGSSIHLTALADGAVQDLDAQSLPLWHDASAFFVGDAVLVELRVAPGDAGVFFEISYLTVGEHFQGDPLQTLCDGDDDRVASSDSRVGRLFMGGCTAWLTSNGSVVTAGHCADGHPDQGGPMLPDGVLDLNGVVEFDVPPSLSDGTPQPADPSDQYPIDLTSVVWNFDGNGQGLGKDWAVFGVQPNATTGLRAHVARGFYRMTREGPGESATTRVTGYGIDNGVDNMTEQTDTGPYVDENSSGADVWHSYRVDTQGANSGSPIIWSAQGVTIGVHTTGGCGPEDGANAGTSFEHDALEIALREFPGPNAMYVDAGMPNLATENGTIFRPFDAILEGVNAVSPGGILSVVKGSYGGTITVTKAMTIEAPVGTVTIGQ